MELVNKLRLFIEGLEKKDFLKYLIVLLVVIGVLVGGILYWHFSRIGSLRDELESVNEIREDEVQPILQRMNKVKLQRKQVNDILAKQEAFKLGEFLDNLLSRQGLTADSRSLSTADVGPKYNEVIEKIRLSNMDMRQLTEFLEKIEKNERVYAKDLEIVQSKKNPGTIEVQVTVATLEPKVKARL